MTKMTKNRDFVTSEWRQNVTFQKKHFFQNFFRKISNMIGLVKIFRHAIIWVKIAKNAFFCDFPNSVIQNPYLMAEFHKHRTLGRAPQPNCPNFGILTLWGILHRKNIVATMAPPPRFSRTGTSEIFCIKLMTVTWSFYWVIVGFRIFFLSQI